MSISPQCHRRFAGVRASEFCCVDLKGLCAVLSQIGPTLTRSGRTCLFVQPNYRPKIGGAEEHGHQIVKHLTKLGERVVVSTRGTATDEEVEFDATCGYPVRRFQVSATPTKNPIEWLHRKQDLFNSTLESIKMVKPDYIISCSMTSLMPLFAIKLAAMTRRIVHAEFVHHLPPGSRERPTRRWTKLREKSALRIPDILLCVSNDTAQGVMAVGIPQHRVHTVYNGIDMHRIDMWRRCLPSPPPFSSNGSIILTVSRLEEYKGIQRVIKAMPKILAEVPSARYVVAGDGSYRKELMRLAHESPARDSIVFLGAVTDDQKFACYERCSLFVLPSSEEGFGLVYLEANAFGKAAIGGDIMAVPEVINHGETGLLVDPFDVDSIADAVVSLLRNPDEMHRLGDAGRKRVISDFTWDVAAKKVLNIIDVAL